MAKNKQTFEDYLKTYIQNQEASGKKDSYEDWLRKSGRDSEKIYGGELRRIDSEYQRSRSGHGATAERLAGIGLSGSGYADYINAAAYYDMVEKRSLAKENKKAMDLENAADYADYSDKYDKKLRASFNSAVKGIENAKITDYTSAYEYAIGSGLSESDADAAAKYATDSVLKQIKESVIKDIHSKKLTGDEALKYAKAFGLSDEVALELSEYAKSVNETIRIKDYPDFYKPKS